MDKVDKLILKTKADSKLPESYWVNLQYEIDEYFKSNTSEEEKYKLLTKGQLDKVLMRCPSLYPKKHS